MEAVLVRPLSIYGHGEAAHCVDKVCAGVLPLCFIVPVAILIAKSVLNRNAKAEAHRALRWKSGIDPSLCFNNREAITKVLTQTPGSRRMGPKSKSFMRLTETVAPLQRQIQNDLALEEIRSTL